MKLKLLKRDFTGSWTAYLQSTTFHEFVPGTPYPAFGIALLFYKPEKRLSVSVWNTKRSANLRLWGPKKLSFER